MNAHKPRLSRFSLLKAGLLKKKKKGNKGRTPFLSAMAENLDLLLRTENLAILKLD